MLSRPGSQRRKAAIAPFSAILMSLLVGMLAFAIDVGWIVVSRTELQSAADAAALAGADPLMDGYVEYQVAATPEAKSAVLNKWKGQARAKAKLFAGYNSAGGKDGLTLKDSDIEFGFVNSAGAYSKTYTGFPNTVKVTLRRDDNANGSLGLFFGPVLGRCSADVGATASATIYAGQVDSFSGSKVGILPITYDINDWNQFLTSGTSSRSEVTTASSNGLRQLQIYPASTSGGKGKGAQNSPGNFGQLILNDNANAGASAIESYVHTGMTADDITQVKSHGLIPLSAHGKNWDWSGKTGFTASLVSAINGYSGQSFLLPLFTPYKTSPSYEGAKGKGSNGEYNIVQFIGIKVMPAAKTNGQLVVQPSAIVSPELVMQSGTVAPAGTGSTPLTTFVAPKLSR